MSKIKIRTRTPFFIRLRQRLFGQIQKENVMPAERQAAYTTIHRNVDWLDAQFRQYIYI